jgi:hypothetical protein
MKKIILWLWYELVYYLAAIAVALAIVAIIFLILTKIANALDKDDSRKPMRAGSAIFMLLGNSLTGSPIRGAFISGVRGPIGPGTPHGEVEGEEDCHEPRM